MKNFQNNKGFTLIELLVVISIIGLLSSLAVVSLNSARVKARDALRKADMAQMRTALGLYYFDNDSYPVCGSTNFDESVADFGATVGTDGEDGSECYITVLDNALTSGAKPIVQKMPKDPKNKINKPLSAGGSDLYIYRYVSDGTGSQYALVYRLEDGGEQVIRGW